MMPSLDTYMGLSFKDKAGISSWLMAHQYRHATYAKAASLRGVSITNFSLSEYPDPDWFANHFQAHSILEPYSVQDPSVSLMALSDGNWDDENAFYDWHQMHTLIHRRLDQGLNIFDR